MLIEMGYYTYSTGVQQQYSLQGYPVRGLMLFVSQEGVEADTFLTVRTPQHTLVERINLDYLHMVSDYMGANADDDTATSAGHIFVDLGLCSLDDSEELVVTLDNDSSYVGTPTTITVGVAAVIEEMPTHDEQMFHYQKHTDSSFSVDACSGLFLFKSSIGTDGSLVNVKQGDNTISTTLRATNWAANLMGKVEVDNNDFGVVFARRYGLPTTINHSATGVTTIARRVVQADPARKMKARARLSNQLQKTVAIMDPQSKAALK